MILTQKQAQQILDQFLTYTNDRPETLKAVTNKNEKEKFLSIMKAQDLCPKDNDRSLMLWKIEPDEYIYIDIEDNNNINISFMKVVKKANAQGTNEEISGKRHELREIEKQFNEKNASALNRFKQAYQLYNPEFNGSVSVVTNQKIQTKLYDIFYQKFDEKRHKENKEVPFEYPDFFMEVSEQGDENKKYHEYFWVVGDKLYLLELDTESKKLKFKSRDINKLQEQSRSSEEQVVVDEEEQSSTGDQEFDLSEEVEADASIEQESEIGSSGESSVETSVDTRKNDDEEEVVITSQESSPAPVKTEKRSVNVTNYQDYTIRAKKWKLCTSPDDLNNIGRGEIAAFGVKEADDAEETNKSTKLSDICDDKTLAFDGPEEIKIPETVRSVIVGKLKQKNTTFTFAAGESPVVKLVENTRNKRIVVKINVKKLTLPPAPRIDLNLQDNGNIQQLECNPANVYIKDEKGESKSLAKLFEDSKGKPVTIGNMILTKEKDFKFALMTKKFSGRDE